MGCQPEIVQSLSVTQAGLGPPSESNHWQSLLCFDRHWSVPGFGVHHEVGLVLND